MGRVSDGEWETKKVIQLTHRLVTMTFDSVAGKLWATARVDGRAEVVLLLTATSISNAIGDYTIVESAIVAGGEDKMVGLNMYICQREEESQEEGRSENEPAIHY